MNQLGAKAEKLIELRDRFGLTVPEFRAVPFAELISNYQVTCTNLENLVNRYLNSEASFEETNTLIAEQLVNIKINQEAVRGIAAEVKFDKVSFRTSAALEDGGTDSFAGQYQSFLDVHFAEDELAEHAKLTFSSMVSPNVVSYAKQRGLRSFKLGGSVIIQRMFYGKSSGVLFTENGFSQIQIAISDSWRNQVVEGEDAREIKVNRFELAEAKLPWQIKRLCEEALRIEATVGRPIDVEFSFDEKELAFLQFRPITTPMLDYSFEWDSTNISENYPGLTLPLTYSLIRQFYGGVYLGFFKMLGASTKAANDALPTLENMLGYLDGRVYYRITNWYEAVKLMPGKRNQEYFEAMLNPVKKRGKAAKSKLDFRSFVTICRLAYLLLSSERISRSFSKRIQATIAKYDAVNFDYLNAATILESGKKIRRELLQEWAYTILNDVRLMVFHGLLQRLFAKSENPKDYLKLMAGLQDKASIKPLHRLSELGIVLERTMQAEGVTSFEELEKTASWPEVVLAAESYINEFGARTPGELKLENERLSDRLYTVLELALKSAKSGIDSAPSLGKRELVWPSKSSYLLRPLILYVAKNTRRAIDWRERFRFNRAQTFNLSRKGFDAVGASLAAEGILETARDIYWLTDQEVEDLVGGHAPILDGKPTVAARKAKFAEYEKLEKTLAVYGSGRIAPMHQVNIEAVAGEDGIAGNGVAPGEVTAEVIVVKSFDPSLDVRGKVLVVHYIDPGWTLLFTQAAAIVAERGNALSHAAIIAREIGIPAIVAAVGATSYLSNGQVVTVNGNTGTIKQ